MNLCVKVQRAKPGEEAYSAESVGDVGLVQPDRVVIEVGSAAGWVKDLCETLAVAIEVANPQYEAWRWKGVKRKTDKDDAPKKIPSRSAWHPVHRPGPSVR